MKDNHHVAELKDGPNEFDIARYVELTERGRRWAKSIEEMEKERKEEAKRG